MAAPTARDLTDELEGRRQAQYYVDAYRGRSSAYNDFHERLAEVRAIYEGNWAVVWPDGEYTEAKPKVTNLVETSANDRARVVAALVPSILRFPTKAGDNAQKEADKVERIVSGWLRRSRVWGHKTQRWSLDAMLGGLMVTQVWMDTARRTPDGWEKIPLEERFPRFEVVRSSLCYPAPVFAPGPGVDSMLICTEERIGDLAARYPEFAGVEWGKDSTVRHDMARLIQYYDDTWTVHVVDPIKSNSYSKKQSQALVVLEERHDLGICPFAIGTRPTATGEYKGEFDGVLGILNVANRMRTLMLEDAVNKVFPERVTYNVENPEDMGPGATIELQTPDARLEYVQQPNQPFSNLQMQRELMGDARAAAIMPPARSGDPNESIISAAGIGAASSQFQLDAASIQKDLLAPMLEKAVFIAGKWDRKLGDVDKTISASQGNFVEKYRPTRDLPERLDVVVRYGEGAGIDPINHGVMVLQAREAGLISQRTAMQLSPFVEDPQREEKQQLKEAILQALQAGMVGDAANGRMTAEQVAEIFRLVDQESKSLAEAVAAVAPMAPAPLAAPGASPGANASAAPGLPGAAAPQNSQLGTQLPPAEELLGQPV